MRAALIVSVVLALAAPVTASAAINVANTNDSGPGSLRQAIADAPPGETIVIPAGTYTLTSGELAIDKALTISGQGAGNTVIRAGGPFRVMSVEGKFAATIAALTVRDGRLTGQVALGGGIVSSEADLTLNGVEVTDNVANASGAAGEAGGEAFGGGIYFEDGRFSLIRSRIVANRAIAVGGAGKGGGAALGGGVYAEGGTIIDSTISGNLADARGGQGPSNASQGGGLVGGGGLFFGAESDDEPATFLAGTVSDNVVDASAGPGGSGGVGVGGGVFATTELPAISFANSTVVSNVLKGANGAILFGGGMFVEGAEGSSSSALSSMTLSWNRIDASAPAVAAGGNLATEVVAPLTIANTIVNAGVAQAGEENCDSEVAVETTSLGFNIDSADQCGFGAPGDRVSTNPLLGPLQLNGGPTATMAPALNSPAIDQGSNFGLTTDQRGVLRPIDLPSVPNSSAPGANGADIGAYELQPSNAFALGKLKKNRKKGTATLVINLPQPSAGVLTLSGKGLKPQTATISGQASVTLKVLTKKGKVRKALRKRGKRKVRIKVTYTPTGNTAASVSRTTKLVKKKPRKGKAKSKVKR